MNNNIKKIKIFLSITVLFLFSVPAAQINAAE